MAYQTKYGAYISLGSVSWGTLRSEDLLRSFLAELDRVRPFNERSLRFDIKEYLEGQRLEDEYAAELVERAFDSLNNVAPPGMYFGAHEGDGSDFGWWEMSGDDQ